MSPARIHLQTPVMHLHMDVRLMLVTVRDVNVNGIC